MIKLRFRTKIEIAIAISFLILMAVITVASVPRTISDTHDDIDTFIRNSNGNYWEATGANIDMALDDLTTDGWVSIPEGTFTISSTITNTVHKITIQGRGRNTVISLADNSNCHVISVGGNGWTIRDLVIDGNGDNQGAGAWYGIYTNNQDNVTIEHVGITNVDKAAIRGGGLIGSSYINVVSCDIYNNNANGFEGEGINNHIKIINCNFVNNTGAVITNEMICPSADWLISGCSFIDNGYRVKLNNITGARVENCYFKNNGGPTGETDGSLSLERCNHSIVSNCIILGTYGSGLALKGCTYIDINNVQIYDYSEGGAACAVLMDDEFLGSGLETTFVTVTGGLYENAGATYVWILEDNPKYITFNGVRFENDTNGLFLEGTCYYVNVIGCNFVDIPNDAISDLWGGAITINSSFSGNIFENCGKGIDYDAADNLMIQNNRFISCTTPIDVDNVNVARPMIMGNNWEGCTNDAHYAAANNPRITSNINVNGDWWTKEDNPE